jgi:hypothetical protein
MSSTVDRHAGLAHVARHARMVAVVAAVRGQVEGHRHALPAGGQRLAVEGVGFFGGGKPAYWRIVQGRTAYMVACGPRR